MFVVFRNDWFSPSLPVERGGGVVMTSGELYSKMDEPQYVPDEYKDVLPRSAEIVSLEDYETDEGEDSTSVNEHEGSFDKRALQAQNRRHEEQQAKQKQAALAKAKAAQKKANALKK